MRGLEANFWIFGGQFFQLEPMLSRLAVTVTASSWHAFTGSPRWAAKLPRSVRPAYSAGLLDILASHDKDLLIAGNMWLRSARRKEKEQYINVAHHDTFQRQH